MSSDEEQINKAVRYGLYGLSIFLLFSGLIALFSGELRAAVTFTLIAAAVFLRNRLSNVVNRSRQQKYNNVEASRLVLKKAFATKVLLNGSEGWLVSGSTDATTESVVMTGRGLNRVLVFIEGEFSARPQNYKLLLSNAQHMQDGLDLAQLRYGKVSFMERGVEKRIELKLSSIYEMDKHRNLVEDSGQSYNSVEQLGAFWESAISAG